jgi:hypothetical protein
LGRINFNAGLTYFANVDDGKVQHRLTLFNTQLSLTQNKDRYYEYFPGDNEYRENIFNQYAVNHPEILTPVIHTIRFLQLFYQTKILSPRFSIVTESFIQLYAVSL